MYYKIFIINKTFITNWILGYNNKIKNGFINSNSLYISINLYIDINLNIDFNIYKNFNIYMKTDRDSIIMSSYQIVLFTRFELIINEFSSI